MKESVTYQEIREEGAIDFAQQTVLRQGRKRFGEPSEQIENVIRSTTDLGRLKQLVDQVPEVSSWRELLSGS